MSAMALTAGPPHVRFIYTPSKKQHTHRSECYKKVGRDCAFNEHRSSLREKMLCLAVVFVGSAARDFIAASRPFIVCVCRDCVVTHKHNHSPVPPGTESRGQRRRKTRSVAGRSCSPRGLTEAAGSSRAFGALRKCCHV